LAAAIESCKACDSAFDSTFDSTFFDSTFDSTFDSAFDSAFFDSTFFGILGFVDFNVGLASFDLAGPRGLGGISVLALSF
jgi:hypothetical protein